ncbi:MAG TPA: Gfo/Idh/MocA family oxidoreductase, partial [Chitinophagaceae bacterium]|nr:Gfo/Idh/MocA family oxidoreductase [Chitinophagaceae bacterium]
DAELTAVASRNYETAEQFANKFPAKHIHGSYQALVENNEVDVIYVATPHNFHHEHTLLCLHNGKAVLCEKAFAVNTAQAKQMIETAKEKKLFLMEAMWTKFLPHYNTMQQMIRDGMIGEVKTVIANFGFKPMPPIPQRIFDPALAGGTMLDIGIYNVFIALSVLGKPDAIHANMSPASTGVDEQCSVSMSFSNGAMAHLFSSFCSNLSTDADICGTHGRIRLAHRFYAPGSTIEFYPGLVDSKQIISAEKETGWGYQHEIHHVCECLRSSKTESPVMTFDDTLLMMQTIDTIRAKAGIRYKEDDDFN